MKIKVSATFIIALFLLFKNSASFSQTAVKSGAINECATWNGTGNFFLGGTLNDGGHTLTASESNRRITSMALGSGSSVLNLEGSNAVDLNTTGSFITCPTFGGTEYYKPHIPGGSGCVFGTVSSEHGCSFTTFYPNNTFIIAYSGWYWMYTRVKIFDNRSDCCWLTDFDLRMNIGAKNPITGVTRLFDSNTSDLWTTWGTSCTGQWVEFWEVSIDGSMRYLNKGEQIFVDVSIRNCQNGWTSGSMPISIESIYYFDHY